MVEAGLIDLVWNMVEWFIYIICLLCIGFGVVVIIIDLGRSAVNLVGRFKI